MKMAGAVDAEVGVEARDDDGGGRLNPIYDRQNQKKKTPVERPAEQKENQSTDWKKKGLEGSGSTDRRTNPHTGCAAPGVGHGD
jgi:hypothetical protein